MVDLLINGKRYQRDDQTLFGEFINSLNRDLAVQSQVISILKINGQGRISQTTSEDLHGIGSAAAAYQRRIDEQLPGRCSGTAAAGSGKCGNLRIGSISPQVLHIGGQLLGFSLGNFINHHYSIVTVWNVR